MKKLAMMTLLATLIPAVLFVFVGCLKKPSPRTYSDPADYGPEVSVDQVREQLMSIKTASPSSIKAGEFHYLERSLRIENLAPEIIQQVAETVVAKEDRGEYYELSVVKTLVEVIDGQSKVSKDEGKLYVKKDHDPLAKNSSLNPFGAAKELLSLPSGSLFAKDLELKEAEPRVTYHNFRITHGSMKVPLLVQVRPDCGRMPEDKCKGFINVSKVSFDRVVWSGDSGEKISFAFVLSPDTPFFASILSTCAQTLMLVQKQRVSVLQCDDVKDFTIGE